MILTHLLLPLQAAPSFLAQTVTQPNPRAEMAKMVFMMVVVVIMFYFVLIRPQQRKAKEQEKLLSTIKTGDRVVTSSGIVGTVLSVKDKVVSIRSADSKLEVLKSAISDIQERAAVATAEK